MKAKQCFLQKQAENTELTANIKKAIKTKVV